MEKPFISECGETMDLAGLLEEHGDHLLRLCTLYLGDRSQAEDAVLLDTTALDFVQSEDALLHIIRERTGL